jgi:hypothetical protein
MRKNLYDDAAIFASQEQIMDLGHRSLEPSIDYAASNGDHFAFV